MKKIQLDNLNHLGANGFCSGFWAASTVAAGYLSVTGGWAALNNPAGWIGGGIWATIAAGCAFAP